MVGMKNREKSTPLQDVDATGVISARKRPARFRSPEEKLVKAVSIPHASSRPAPASGPLRIPPAIHYSAVFRCEISVIRSRDSSRFRQDGEFGRDGLRPDSRIDVQDTR